MPETRETLDMIWRYVNSKIWLALFLLSVIYLFIIAKKRQKWAIVISILSLALFINDYVLVFVERTMGESARYYRYLWVIPFVFFIMTAMVDAFRRWKHIIPRVFLLAGSGVVAVLLFQNSGLRYMSVPNIDLIPTGLSEISDELDTIREEKGKDLFVACQKDLHDFLKMYNEKIYIGEGKTDAGEEAIALDRNARLQEIFSSEEPDVAYLMSYCCARGYDYVVVSNQENSRKCYEEAGYTPVVANEQYALYPCIGYEGYTQDYTDWGQLEWKTFTNPEGAPRMTEAGYATIRYTYDQRGQKIEESYYGTTGQPCILPLGYAAVRYEYDDRGRNIRLIYSDSEGNPVNRLDARYASRRTDYNSANQIIHESYFDAEGFQTMLPSGYASYTREYDGNKRMIRETYLDADGQPVIWIGGYASEERVYDEKDRIVSRKYYDADNHLKVTTSGYAEVQTEYNEAGQITRETYFGADGLPFRKAAGHVGIAQIWDENGRLTDRIYLNEMNEPANRVDGYARAEWIKTDDCEVVRFLTADGLELPAEGLNLSTDIKTDEEGWSAWMRPTPNSVNYCFNIGFANLGIKQAGDLYTSQIEVEFSGVTGIEGKVFRFWTQGAVDGSWYIGNVWDGGLICMEEVPEDGIYRFTCTRELNEKMAVASTFNIGFRCDYWASGMFRVRNVKVEKGSEATAWQPGV